MFKKLSPRPERFISEYLIIIFKDENIFNLRLLSIAAIFAIVGCGVSRYLRFSYDASSTDGAHLYCKYDLLFNGDHGYALGVV